MMEANKSKPAASQQMRRALELLARNFSPSHQPVARSANLTDLLEKDAVLDLSQTDLRGAWLRGLKFGPSQLPQTAHALWGANLEGADRSHCKLNPAQLAHTRLLHSQLPAGFTPLDSALHIPPAHPLPLALPYGHQSAVTSLAVLPDGRFLSGSDDNSIRLWQLGEAEPLQSFTGHEGRVTSLAVLPDGRFLSGSSDNSIRLWQSGEAEPLQRFTGHKGEVTSLALRDERELISAGRDGIRCWNLDTGLCTCGQFVLDGAVVMLADKTGLHFSRTDGQGWKSMVVSGRPRPLPNDPLLNRFARFVADSRWSLPIYEYPDRFYWDDNSVPKQLTLPWPEGFDYQQLLGQARQPAPER